MKLLKHIIRTLFALLALVCTTSCENEFIKVIPNTDELVFDYYGGDTILTVRCTEGTMWYVETKPAEWCEVYPETGQSGDIIKVSVSPNTFQDRRATLKLVCAGKSKAIDIVVQARCLTPGKIVDLGLSVKWAGWNIGATSPEGYGGYYAWGETTEKSDYLEKNYKHYNTSTGEYTHICDNISGTWIYDVALSKWGGGWRMPTKEEIEELVKKCTWEWGPYKGVNGQYVIGPNGNSIFLPAAGRRYAGELYIELPFGYYWSATNYDDDSAHRLLFTDGDVDCFNLDLCYCGNSVRAVTE